MKSLPFTDHLCFIYVYLQAKLGKSGCNIRYKLLRIIIDPKANDDIIHVANRL